MITIDDLTGIHKTKRKQIIECLDDLLTYRDEQGNLSPIISGYNFYTKLAKSDRLITFSHIHETETYKQDMLRDLVQLGYDSQTILEQIREKSGVFLHDLKFNIRDDNGKLLPYLRIRDIKTGNYLNLEEFHEPLINYLQFSNSEAFLADENQGWELDLFFNTKEELLILINLFLNKSGSKFYDKNNNLINESNEVKNLRKPWTDAYKTPVLLLERNALLYEAELPNFIRATKFSLKENSNEINFIIHKRLENLKDMAHYESLLQLGFVEELCLGNKKFIEYIDEIRKI